MAIKMQLEKGSFCPLVFCDFCGLQIEDAKRGTVLFEWAGVEARPTEPAPVALRFTHKACDPDMRRLASRRPLAPGERPRTYAWQELGGFVFYLANNLGMQPLRRKLPRPF